MSEIIGSDDDMLDSQWAATLLNLINTASQEYVDRHEEQTRLIVSEIQSVAKARLKQRTLRELIDVVCHS